MVGGSTVKEMTTNFGKLNKFEGRRAKCENDDYIFRGHILNEDASSKNFLKSNFNNYKMVDSRPVMEQFNELLRILRQYTQHSLKMDESISISSVIDKSPPSWKDFKHTLKHGKDDLSLVQLGSHLRIEESLRAQDSDKGKGKKVDGASVNMTEEGKNKNNKQNKGKKHGFKESNSGSGSNNKPKLMQLHGGLILVPQLMFVKIVAGLRQMNPSRKSITLFNVLHVPKLHKNLISGPVLNKSGYKQVYESNKYILSKSGVFVGFGYYNNGMFMLNLNKVPNDSGSVYMSSSTVANSSLWHARLGHVYYKRMLEMSKDDLIPVIDVNPEKWSGLTYKNDHPNHVFTTRTLKQFDVE
ncbi:zinc finger, CCHC-type containing protein [Tanacetum coccineum]